MVENIESIDKLLLIGSSNGGPEAVEFLVSSIYHHLNNSSIIIQNHLPEHKIQLLLREHNIVCQWLEHGMTLDPGEVYVVPPDQRDPIYVNLQQIKLYEEKQSLILGVDSEYLIDPLFRSMVRLFQDKCIGVILSGFGDDGCVGADYIRAAGGELFFQKEKGGQVKYGEYDVHVDNKMAQAAHLFTGTGLAGTLPEISQALIKLLTKNIKSQITYH